MMNKVAEICSQYGKKFPVDTQTRTVLNREKYNTDIPYQINMIGKCDLLV